ncbi:MAG: hypothetical protein AAGG50_08590 [Bacteroidota bacterium]
MRVLLLCLLLGWALHAQAQPSQLDRTVAAYAAAGATVLPVLLFSELADADAVPFGVALAGMSGALIFGPATGYVLLGEPREALRGLWHRTAALSGAVVVTSVAALALFDDNQFVVADLFDSIAVGVVASIATLPLQVLIYRDFQRIRRPPAYRAALAPTALRVAGEPTVPGVSLQLRW